MPEIQRRWPALSQSISDSVDVDLSWPNSVGLGTTLAELWRKRPKSCRKPSEFGRVRQILAELGGIWTQVGPSRGPSVAPVWAKWPRTPLESAQYAVAGIKHMLASSADRGPIRPASPEFAQASLRNADRATHLQAHLRPTFANGRQWITQCNEVPAINSKFGLRCADRPQFGKWLAHIGSNSAKVEPSWSALVQTWPSLATIDRVVIAIDSRRANLLPRTVSRHWVIFGASIGRPARRRVCLSNFGICRRNFRPPPGMLIYGSC